MTDIATILKAEITRLARKEIRKETAALKKLLAQHRTEIAQLKRQTRALELALKRAGKERVVPKPSATEDTSTKLRFSAKGFATLRQRLALSAEQVGLLVGTSSQSIYNWEGGKTKPRATHLPAIALLRTLGKKEAAAKASALAEKAQ